MSGMVETEALSLPSAACRSAARDLMELRTAETRTTGSGKTRAWTAL